jgi:hypothetical protein
MDCGKKTYESEGMALAILDEMKSNRIKEAKLLSVYKCEECEMWHFTSNPNYH